MGQNIPSLKTIAKKAWGWTDWDALALDGTLLMGEQRLHDTFPPRNTLVSWTGAEIKRISPVLARSGKALSHELQSFEMSCKEMHFKASDPKFAGWSGKTTCVFRAKLAYMEGETRPETLEMWCKDHWAGHKNPAGL